MSYAPKNIRKLVAENDTIAKATSHVVGLKKTQTSTAWHERDFQKLSTHPAIATREPPGQFIATSEMQDAGMRSGIETVKLARAERLRELFERETLQYEAELGAMGLALVKPRD